MTGSLEQLAGLRELVGLRFIVQRTVCASIVARVVFIEGERALNTSAFWRGRYLLQLQRLLAKMSKAAVCSRGTGGRGGGA